MMLLPPALRLRPLQAPRWLVGLLLLLVSSTPAPGQGSGASREYQIKSVFLFNFAQFIEWPAGTFGADDAPFVIAIVGDDPFGAALDETIRGEKIGTHPLVVKRFRHGDEVGPCQILFVTDSESGRLDALLATLAGRSVLTVGDTEHFARRGGMIQLVMENNHMRLKINLAAAKGAGLLISSKLLRPATIVATGRE